MRQMDIAPILGVTVQRVSQIVAEREDFPAPAKVVGKRRLWRRMDGERWREAEFLPRGQSSESGSLVLAQGRPHSDPQRKSGRRAEGLSLRPTRRFTGSHSIP